MSAKIERPKVISDSAQSSFEDKCHAVGLDPADLWIGGYVDYEWDHLRLILEGYQLDPCGLNVLEFGSNVGASAIIFAHLGANVTAIDIDNDLIAVSRLNAERYGKSEITFLHVPDTRKLPFDDCYFDLVNCNSVLEYVESDKLKAVQTEIDRVLKTEGKILVTGTSSRIWPMEIHSKRWFVNYIPRFLDRVFGYSDHLQRGLEPWLIRYGFGRNYKNLDAEDKGAGYLRTRTMMSPSRTNEYRTLVRLSRIMGISPGLLTSNISCLLQKEKIRGSM